MLLTFVLLALIYGSFTYVQAIPCVLFALASTRLHTCSLRRAWIRFSCECLLMASWCTAPLHSLPARKPLFSGPGVIQSFEDGKCRTWLTTRVPRTAPPWISVRPVTLAQRHSDHGQFTPLRPPFPSVPSRHGLLVRNDLGEEGLRFAVFDIYFNRREFPRNPSHDLLDLVAIAMAATPPIRRPWGHRVQRVRWREHPEPQLVIWGDLPPISGSSPSRTLMLIARCALSKSSPTSRHFKPSLLLPEFAHGSMMLIGVLARSLSSSLQTELAKIRSLPIPYSRRTLPKSALICHSLVL